MCKLCVKLHKPQRELVFYNNTDERFYESLDYLINTYNTSFIYLVRTGAAFSKKEIYEIIHNQLANSRLSEISPITLSKDHLFSSTGRFTGVKYLFGRFEFEKGSNFINSSLHVNKINYIGRDRTVIIIREFFTDAFGAESYTNHIYISV
jgi:hypothetical protein